MSLDAQDVGVTKIIEACDALAERLEEYLHGLEAELPEARAGGDQRRIYRVERGITWARELLDLLDDDILERVGALRHNHHQLRWARKGKMV